MSARRTIAVALLLDVDEDAVGHADELLRSALGGTDVVTVLRVDEHPDASVLFLDAEDVSDLSIAMGTLAEANPDDANIQDLQARVEAIAEEGR